MTFNYVKYCDLNNNPCNKIEFFSGYMDAYERRCELLKIKEGNQDLFYDGFIGRIEYFNRRELIVELNKISNITDNTFEGHII